MALFERKSTAEKALDRARRQWDRLDFDVDLEDVRERVRDLPLPRRHEEPESSSAGFIAGVAVGLLLGVVLAYLFGKGGGSEMVDQFAHRAEGLKETAAEKYHQVRDQGAAVADDVADTADDGPAIEREIDGEGDTFVDVAEGTVDNADELRRRAENV